MPFAKYVVGFLYRYNRNTPQANTEVLLLQKSKPQWQAGFWNGVGGKIERGEKPDDAMRREFYEEAGVLVSCWDLFATLRVIDGNTSKPVAKVWCYAGRCSTLHQEPEAKTEEPIQWFKLNALPLGQTIRNVPLLVSAGYTRLDRRGPLRIDELAF